MESIIIDGCNILKERKFLIHTDKYNIGEDGLIDGEIPFTDICYDLALQLKRLKDKSEKISYRFKQTKKANKQYKNDIKNLQAENEKLKKEHYETLKMLKHEYDGRQRDNKQWFTRCTENHNEDSKIIEKYRKALEDIREILCYGRTFYDGYFDSNKLSRTDEAIKRVNEVLDEG